MTDALDCIDISDLRVRCIIGVDEHERHERQDVVLRIRLYADLRAAGRSDDIADTINYRSIKQSVFQMVEASRYCLVEALAQRVAELCLEDERIRRAWVRVEKPGALRFARTVAVEITRERGDDG